MINTLYIQYKCTKSTDQQYLQYVQPSSGGLLGIVYEHFRAHPPNVRSHRGRVSNPTTAVESRNAQATRPPRWVCVHSFGQLICFMLLGDCACRHHSMQNKSLVSCSECSRMKTDIIISLNFYVHFRKKALSSQRCAICPG